MSREGATFTEQIGDELVQYAVIDTTEFPDGDQLDSEAVDETEVASGGN